MRKILLGLAATIGILATLGLTAPANAVVAVNDGVGHVDKGDVQKALKWNNPTFDQNVVVGGKDVTFTGSYTATYDNVLTCGANAGGKVVHVPVTTTSTDAVLKATQVLSSNNRQVTGWNLTGLNGTAPAAANDLNAVMQAMFTACLPDKPYSEMTPEELRRLPVKVDTPTAPAVSLTDLKVNGVALPNTPVV